MGTKQNVPCEKPSTKDSPHGKYRQTQRNECPVDSIPDYVFESLARGAVPIIQAYYESEEGREAYEEWKAKQDGF